MRYSKEDGIWIAGGSLLGEVLIWDLDQSELAFIMRDGEYGLENDQREVKVETLGRLRRLNGHRVGILFLSTSFRFLYSRLISQAIGRELFSPLSSHPSIRTCSLPVQMIELCESGIYLHSLPTIRLRPPLPMKTIAIKWKDQLERYGVTKEEFGELIGSMRNDSCLLQR